MINCSLGIEQQSLTLCVCLFGY